MTRFGCVVLTAGRRPDDLRAAVGSLQRQEGVETDIVVVGNGCDPDGVPDGVRVVALPVDEGIPNGRNAGVPHVAGDLLFFLDDDAELAQTDALARVAAAFAAEPELALLQLRVEANGGGPRSRDWIPRLRNGDPARSSELTVVWEGALGVRPEVLAAVGGWPAPFRFVHEGVDLGWRVLDAGLHDPLRGGHPGTSPLASGGGALLFVLFRCAQPCLARAPLPAAAAGHPVRDVLRAAHRPPPEVQAGRAGGGAGLPGRDARPGARAAPARARTLLRMTRIGRPPIM